MASGFINRRPTRIFTTGVLSSATYTTSASVGPVTAYTFTGQAYCVAHMFAQTAALGSAGLCQPVLTFTSPIAGGPINVSGASLPLKSDVGNASQVGPFGFIAASGSNFTYSLTMSGVTGSAVVAYAVVLEML